MIGLETSRGGKINLHVSLQTSCLMVMSHGTVLCASCFGFRYIKTIACNCPVSRETKICSTQKIRVSFERRPLATWIFCVEQILMSPSRLGNKCIILNVQSINQIMAKKVRKLNFEQWS